MTAKCDWNFPVLTRSRLRRAAVLFTMRAGKVGWDVFPVPHSGLKIQFVSAVVSLQCCITAQGEIRDNG